MNTSIHAAFLNAILADASYVPGLLKDDTGQQLADKLAERLTKDLAKYVGDNFAVVSQYTDVGSSGFSVTVFVDSAGQKYVSFRGTEPSDWQRDFVTDADAYVGSGLAQRQILAMVNWYERATAREGSAVTQLIEVVDAGSGTSHLESTTITAIENGALIGSDGATVQVNGHSLGGHLATVFTRLFSGAVSSTSTYNGLGIGRIFPEPLLVEVGKAQTLPDTRGSGMVRDLRQAASPRTDAGQALAAKLGQFAQATTRTAQRAVINDLISTWGNTSGFADMLTRAREHRYTIGDANRRVA